MNEWKIKGGNLYLIIDNVMRIRISKKMEDFQPFLKYDFRQYNKDNYLYFEFNPEQIRTRNKLQFTLASYNVQELGLQCGDEVLCEFGKDFFGFRLKKVQKNNVKEQVTQ